MSEKQPYVRKKELSRELIDNVRSGASLIYVTTNDEKSTVEDIQRCVGSLNLHKDAGKDRTYGYYEWSCTRGVVQGKMDAIESKESHYVNYLNNKTESEGIVMPEKHEPDETIDALRALNFFSKPAPSAKKHDFDCHVCVMKDMHPQLKDVRVIRKVKDIVIHNDDDLNVIRKCLIIVSPVQQIPIELRNLAIVLDWSLPDKEEIFGYLNQYSITEVTKEETEAKGDKPWKTSYSEERVDNILDALSGMSIPEIDNVVTVSQVKYGEIKEEFLIQQKKQMILKNGLLEYHEADVDFNDVGGMEELKDWLRMRKPAFTKDAKDFGVETPKGVMLVGPPGCGKSYIAKATASLLKMPLIRFDVGKVFSQTVGSSEANVREVIRIIEAVAPCVVMIDEIEKGLAGVQSSNSSDAGTTARVVGTLLSWMNDKVAPAFIVATANNISQLPPELSRKGRFDEIFFVSLPEQEERKSTFEIHLRKRGFDLSKYDVEQFSKFSKEWSNSECEEAIKAALILAYHERQTKGDNTNLENRHILAAIHTLIPLSKTSHEDMAALYNWVDFDVEKKDGIRARYASKAIKERMVKSGDGNVNLSFVKTKKEEKKSK